MMVMNMRSVLGFGFVEIAIFFCLLRVLGVELEEFSCLEDD